jgi:hypothetical protein
MAGAAMIVKVQLPLASSEVHPKALVYDETRTIEVQVPITDALRKRMDGSPKRFFEAEVKAGALALGREVEDPGW